MADILNYSLADFFFNDNPDVLAPPEDFEEWRNHPLVKGSFKFFEQQFLEAPRTSSRIYSGVDLQERQVINLTSYNYLGLSTHPEVIQAAKEALDTYGMSASGAPLLSGTFDIHVDFARKLAEFKQKEDCILYSSGLGGNVGAIQGILRKGDYLIMDESSIMAIVG